MLDKTVHSGTLSSTTMVQGQPKRSSTLILTKAFGRLKITKDRALVAPPSAHAAPSKFLAVLPTELIIRILSSLGTRALLSARLVRCFTVSRSLVLTKLAPLDLQAAQSRRRYRARAAVRDRVDCGRLHRQSRQPYNGRPRATRNLEDITNIVETTGLLAQMSMSSRC